MNIVADAIVFAIVSGVSHSFQVILAEALTGVQGDTRCKVLAALSTVELELELA